MHIRSIQIWEHAEQPEKFFAHLPCERSVRLRLKAFPSGPSKGYSTARVATSTNLTVSRDTTAAMPIL